MTAFFGASTRVLSISSGPRHRHRRRMGVLAGEGQGRERGHDIEVHPQPHVVGRPRRLHLKFHVQQWKRNHARNRFNSLSRRTDSLAMALKGTDVRTVRYWVILITSAHDHGCNATTVGVSVIANVSAETHQMLVALSKWFLQSEGRWPSPMHPACQRPEVSK